MRAPLCYLTRQALFNTPFFGGVTSGGERAVDIVLGQHDADFFDREHGLLRFSHQDALGLDARLDDLLELFGGLRGNYFCLGSVTPVKMNCEIPKVRGYVCGIHDLGFSVGRFTRLYTQAETPAANL